MKNKLNIKNVIEFVAGPCYKILLLIAMSVLIISCNEAGVNCYDETKTDTTHYYYNFGEDTVLGDKSRRCEEILMPINVGIIARVDRHLLKLDILYTANSMPPIEGFIITNSIGNIVTTDGASIGPIKGVTQHHSINLGNIAAGVYSIVAIGPNNVPISDVYQFIIQ